MSVFISFEGLDGSGKSTQAVMLAAALRARHRFVLETREPGGTPLGERIRELILDPGSPAPTPRAMALLLSAARAQLVEEVIRPALESGTIVITDRYADSTIAYQSFGLGLNRDVLEEITSFATTGVRPDRVILVDIEPETAMQRSKNRGSRDRLDAQTLAFHRRVRDGYEYLAARQPDLWYRVDGAQSMETVHRCVLAAVEPILCEKAEAR